MNPALEQLAARLGLSAPGREGLRLAFGHACASRVRHLLEDAEVGACLATLGEFLAGRCDAQTLAAQAARAAALARAHPGSRSIDGCGHAAVSASHAVAKALEGRALDAANYAAYAIVYAQGGSAAVAERESFAAEFAWQVETLAGLVQQRERSSA